MGIEVRRGHVKSLKGSMLVFERHHVRNASRQDFKSKVIAGATNAWQIAGACEPREALSAP